MLHAYQADKCCWAGNLIPLLPLQNRCFVFTSDPFAFLFAYASILQSFPVYLKHFQSTSSVFRIPTYKLIRDSWDTSKIAKYTRKCKRPLVLPTFSMILLVWHIVSKGKDRSCPWSSLNSKSKADFNSGKSIASVFPWQNLEFEYPR
jgi:hypothetical protein